MRILVAALVAVGCNYEHGRLSPHPDADLTGDPVPVEPDGGPTDTPRTCKYPDPSLRLCLEFDDGQLEPVVRDGSSFRIDAVSQNLSELSRDGIAAGFDHGSDLHVPETPDLDLTGAFTIELWVFPAYTQSTALVRNSGQYQMMIDAEGGVSCSIGGSTSGAHASAKLGWAWTHVACTYDGSRLQLWVNGTVADCYVTESKMTTSGTAGTQFVPGWVGALDDIRIYTRVLTSGEMCTHAGKTGCNNASVCNG